MPRFRFSSGPLAGLEHEFDGELLIGRDEGGLALEDAEVSTRHAVLRPVDGEIEVEDLGSRNGTWVDGERIEGVHRITTATEVRFGRTTLLLVPDGMDAGPVPRRQTTAVSDVPPGIGPSPSAEAVAPAAPQPPARDAGEPPSAQPTTIRDAPAAPQPAAAQSPPAPAEDDGTGFSPPPSYEAPTKAFDRPADLPPAPARPASGERPAADASSKAAMQARQASRPAPPRAQSAPSGPDKPFGAYRVMPMPKRARRPGVATRLWLPAAATIGTIMATTGGLVVYFLER